MAAAFKALTTAQLLVSPQLSLDERCGQPSPDDLATRQRLKKAATFVPTDTGPGNTTGPADLDALAHAVDVGNSGEVGIRCVGPDSAPSLGVFCRSSMTPPSSVHGGSVATYKAAENASTSVSDATVLVINLANSTQEISLLGKGGSPVSSATEIRTGQTVALPLSATPLQVFLLHVLL